MRRVVALKLIKLGLDTREVVARFEAERQALALVDHRRCRPAGEGVPAWRSEGHADGPAPGRHVPARAGDPAAAAALRATVDAIDRQLPKPGAEDIGEGPENFLICQVLRREAEEVLRSAERRPNPVGDAHSPTTAPTP